MSRDRLHDAQNVATVGERMMAGFTDAIVHGRYRLGDAHRARAAYCRERIAATEALVQRMNDAGQPGHRLNAFLRFWRSELEIAETWVKRWEALGR